MENNNAENYRFENLSLTFSHICLIFFAGVMDASVLTVICHICIEELQLACCVFTVACFVSNQVRNKATSNWSTITIKV